MADFRQRNGVPRPMDEEKAVGVPENSYTPGSRPGSRAGTPTPEQRGLLNERRNGHHRHVSSEVYTHHNFPTGQGLKRFSDRFLRRDKKKVGVAESLKNIVFSSCALQVSMILSPSLTFQVQGSIFSFSSYLLPGLRTSAMHPMKRTRKGTSATVPPFLVRPSDVLPFSSLRELMIIIVCFLAILPLEKLFEFCGEQLTFYVGRDFGDLIIVSLAK